MRERILRSYKIRVTCLLKERLRNVTTTVKAVKNLMDVERSTGGKHSKVFRRTRMSEQPEQRACPGLLLVCQHARHH